MYEQFQSQEPFGNSRRQNAPPPFGVGQAQARAYGSFPEWLAPQDGVLDKASIPKPAAQEQEEEDLEQILPFARGHKIHLHPGERGAETDACPVPEGPATRARAAHPNRSVPVSPYATAMPEPPEIREEEPEEVMVRAHNDRRLLPNVPPRGNVRASVDRRGQSEITRKTKRGVLNPSLPEHRGVRFDADFPVQVVCHLRDGGAKRFTCRCRNISTNGIQLHVVHEIHLRWMQESRRVALQFRIEPGVMPEGYEMRVKTGARAVFANPLQEGGFACGMEFSKSLVHHAYKRKGRNLRFVAVFSLGVLVLAILLMRTTSATTGNIGRLAYLYTIVTSTYLLTRFLFGAMYKPTPINPHYTPGVSIVIPCYDEEKWIQRTILSCLNQEYPQDKLEVIIVDDHSRDKSPQKIQELLRRLETVDDLYDTVRRVRYVRQPSNQGKREAMARGTAMARHDLVVFVDSDSFLDPRAIINLVQPFQDPKVGGVSGRTDVVNSYTNALTKMQSVKYYFSFRIIKAAEGYFNAVTCLSGPLSCYRKTALEKNIKAWLNQTFLGRKATFGDDRSMTNFILREYRTDYQDTAVCSTIVPNKHRMFLRQQMRWKRSWLRETSIAATFMWKKEPFMALSFYLGFIIPIIAPVIVFYNLIYLPVFHGTAPITFLVGFFAMSMMMSMAQLLMRRSSLWWYGLGYNLYHILVLIWQMPIAWFTFWKSTWGTRMTTSDLRARRRFQNDPLSMQADSGG